MQPSLSSDSRLKPRIRWWPAIGVLVIATVLILFFQTRDDIPFQLRNMRSIGTGLISFLVLVVWWLALSRAAWKTRLVGLGGLLALLGMAKLTFRYKGVSGDLIPIFEPRWAKAPVPSQKPTATSTVAPVPSAPAASTGLNARPDFPQFLGPNRTAVLDGPALDPDWSAHPPRILWRQPVGAAWSGFVIVGERALTQEQDGSRELVTCRDLMSGRSLWTHAHEARYYTAIAGEGPRATPTVVSNRVYALGATGRLNCLDLATGAKIWSRDMAADADAKMPEWGYSGSPLYLDGRIVVSAGGKGKSLIAYRADAGEIAWTGGDAGANYGSPFFATLAGVPQILAFNSGRITSHDAKSGSVLWEHDWGVGMPHVAAPVVVGSDSVVFSSGYAVGAALLKVTSTAAGKLEVSDVWTSKKMKAKFANLVARDGFLYGLDDGILACVDLKDGSQPWKEGRYGHGQGLLVRDTYLLMSEGGELVLLKPTPAGPGELHRFRVFDGKTWNPIALSGDILLARTDVEAACLQVAIQRP